MVRWQNQEDPGYATPSSSEDELEEPEYKTPTKLLRHNVLLPKSDCHTDIWQPERCHSLSLAGWNKTSVNDASLWGWNEDGWGESEEWKKPVTPGGGVRVPKNKHNKIRSRKTKRQHYKKRKKQTRKKPSDFLKHGSAVGAGSWYRANTENGHWSQQHSDPSLVKARGRQSVWPNAHSVWGERSDEFSSPSPTHNSTKSNNKLESFLSLLPLGKYLLTPEKPKNRPPNPGAEPSLMYATSTPDI